MRFILLFLLFLLCHCLAAAQQNTADQHEEITSDDFSRTRDITNDLKKGNTVFVFKKPTYRLKRVKKPVKPIPAKFKRISVSSSTKYKFPVDTKSAMVWKRLGVSIWRLSSDKKGAGSGGQNESTIRDSDTDQQYKPTRVSAETVFAPGDKVRLSFESPNSGYLYVINREVYTDNTVGEPRLIFPTMMARGGNNLVVAGQTVEVPGQSDRVLFFELESKNKNWRGELLTVIVSPEPLTDIEIPDGPSPISAALVGAMEQKYLKSVSEYEQQGSAGKTYTKAEKEAGASLTRELTQKDPFPQTMFRVKIRQREPLLVNFGLTVK